MNTKYWLNAIAQNIYKIGGASALPTKFYLGLSTTHPNADGGNVNEPKGNGYKRVELTGLVVGETGHATNSTDIRFPESTGDQGVMTDWLLYDAEENGHLLEFDSFRKGGSGGDKYTAVKRTIETGTILVIRARSIDLWFKDDTIPPAA